MNSMRRYTSIGVAAGVIAGGALGFGLSAAGVTSAGPGRSSPTPAPVNASVNASPVQAAPIQVEADGHVSDPPFGPSRECIEKMQAHRDKIRTHIEEIRAANAERLTQRLAPLVANGTLSEEQVAAIVDHLQADRAAQAAEARNKVLKKLRSVRSGWSQRP